MKWWYWALAGSGLLIILGIVGAFILGLIPITQPPIGRELARHTHDGTEFILVEYENELAVFSGSGAPVTQPELARAVLHSYAWGQVMRRFDPKELEDVSGKVETLNSNLSGARGFTGDVVAIFDELEYLEADIPLVGSVSAMDVVRDSFSGVSEAETLIRTLESELYELNDNGVALSNVAERVSSTKPSSVTGAEMDRLFGEAAEATSSVASTIRSVRDGLSRINAVTSDLRRGLLKASVTPVFRDTLRDFTSMVTQFESELDNLSGLLGAFESELSALGQDMRNAISSADQTLQADLVRWLQEPYDKQWPPTDSKRRAAAVAQGADENRRATLPAPAATPAFTSSSVPVTSAEQPFALEWEASTTELQAGESFTLRVRMHDIRQSGEHGGISVSFPSVTEPGGSKERHSSSTAVVEAVDYTTGLSQVAFHQPGATIYHRENNRQFAAEYLLVESDDPSWTTSGDRTLELRITPKIEGEFQVRVRGWLCADNYTNCSRNPGTGSMEDQQGWVVEQVTVTVTTPTTTEQTDVEITLQAVVAAGTGGHSCGLRQNGKAICWGDNNYGQASPPEGYFTKVSLGSDHSCGLLSDGTAECWGRNHLGQANPPRGNFIDISAGLACTCALREDGTAVCWGCDRDPNTAHSDFGNVPSGNFTKISVGAGHSCALRKNGEVVCWGDNRRKGANPSPGQFVDVSAGGDHSCGLRADGEAVCWGTDWEGYGAEEVPPGIRFTSVSAGWAHTCAMSTEGEVMCWGKNDDGEASPPSGKFASVSAGSDHSCGQWADGEAVCWGRNRDGQASPPGGNFVLTGATTTPVSTNQLTRVPTAAAGQLPATTQQPFALEWEASTTEVETGESFTLRVRMHDIRQSGEHGGISVSFPGVTEPGGSKERHSSSTAVVEAVDYSAGLSRVAFHQPGATIYHRENNRQFAAEYLLVESDDPSWSGADDRTLELRITPKKAGEFQVQVRGWLCADGYTDCSRQPASGSTEDQQGWLVEQVTVTATTSASTATQTTSDQSPGFASFSNFRITRAKANYPEEAIAAVQNEFGNEWRIADWNDLKEAWSAHERNIKSVFEGTEAGATIVTRNGEVQWGDRTYFVEDHNGSRPGYFLAHDELGGHEISLGSWYIWEWDGDGLRVLAIRKSE